MAAVERALSFARRFDHTELSEYLDTCIDAYEAAGYADKALEYLHELAALRRKTMNAAMIPLTSGEFAEAAQSLTDDSLSDNPLLARAHLLEVRVNEDVQRLLEIAINAEMASGYDLYRPFRVGNLARCLGAAIGWNERRVASLALGGQLCNIGMMAIPTRVLLRSEGLSEGEWHLVHDHPRYGAELLSKSKTQALDVASLVAEQHHERYDGKGYPQGLIGEAISEEARIVAICDAFDAITHQRPWRLTPLSIQAALNELEEAARSQFDPLFVQAFVNVIRHEVEQHDDFEAFLVKGADEFEYVRARARMDSLLSTQIQ